MGGTVLDGLWHRSWPTLVTLAVAGYALAWSWSARLQTVGNAVFWLSACAVALGLLVGARHSSAARRWLLAATAFAAVIALTVLWSVTPSETFKDVITFGAVLVLAATAGAELQRDAAGRRRLAGALAWLAPGALALTVLVVLAGLVDDSVAGPGASGFFNGPNVLSIFLALTLPFALVHPRIAARLGVLLALVAAAALAAAFSSGRAGFAALLIALYAVSTGRRRLDVLASGLVVVVLAAAVASESTWTPPTLGEPIALTTEQTDVVAARGSPGQSILGELTGARSEAWGEAVRLLDERPLQGHGFGTGDALFDRYGSRERFTYFVGAFASGTNPHNAYLQMPLELGIPIGLLFLAPVLAALALAGRFVVRGADASTIAFSASVVAAAAAACFESTLAHFGSLTLLTWIAVAAVGAIRLHGRGSLHSAT